MNERKKRNVKKKKEEAPHRGEKTLERRRGRQGDRFLFSNAGAGRNDGVVASGRGMTIKKERKRQR